MYSYLGTIPGRYVGTDELNRKMTFPSWTYNVEGERGSK